jgi:hypothetical protein
VGQRGLTALPWEKKYMPSVPWAWIPPTNEFFQPPER